MTSIFSFLGHGVIQVMFGSYNWELIDMENAMIAGHNTHRQPLLLIVSPDPLIL